MTTTETEAWMVHWPHELTALPWDAALDWHAVVTERQPLPAPAKHFGCVAFADDTEIPAVPPDQPRGVPTGDYAMWVRHEADALIVIVDAAYGPTVLTREEIAAHRPVTHEAPIGVNLGIAHDRTLWRYVRYPEGNHAAQSECFIYGPRRAEVLDPPPPSEFVEAHGDDWYRCAWRLQWRPKSGSLQMACSVHSRATIEHVAIGCSMLWAPRRDAMLQVHLRDLEPQAPGPDLRTMILRYDPATETGRWCLHWRDLYGSSEEMQGHPTRPLHTDRLALRLNREMRSYPLAETVETDSFAIRDGFNQVEVVTAGGDPVRFTLEKRSGHRVSLPPGVSDSPLDMAAIRAGIEPELRTMETWVDAYERDGAPYELPKWPLYHAASCARAYRHLMPDKRFLRVLRSVADWSLTEQRDDGTYAGYHLSWKRKPTGERWLGGAYDSGQVGELWTVAAELLGDDRYLDASRRLVQAYSTYRLEWNHNYAAFALFHLTAHYRLTGDALALEHALYYARHLVVRDIMPSGCQDGHNHYTVYSFIILRGMSRLAAVLPADHPERAWLQERCTRMLNQCLSRLQPDGSYDSMDRYFVDERIWVYGPFSAAFVLPPSERATVDRAIRHMLQAPPSTFWFRLLEGDLLRYLAARDDLLSGAAPTHDQLF